MSLRKILVPGKVVTLSFNLGATARSYLRTNIEICCLDRSFLLLSSEEVSQLRPGALLSFLLPFNLLFFLLACNFFLLESCSFSLFSSFYFFLFFLLSLSFNSFLFLPLLFESGFLLESLTLLGLLFLQPFGLLSFTLSFFGPLSLLQEHLLGFDLLHLLHELHLFL